VTPMYKIGVIGRRETVMGFKALGLDVFPVENSDEAKRLLRRLRKPEESYAIIYLEETLAKDLTRQINALKGEVMPAIILIPGREGSLGLGQAELRAAVERAVGTNIL